MTQPLPSARRYRFGARVLDLDRMRIEDGEQQLTLTSREFEVLSALIASGGSSIDRDALQRKIWGSSSGRALENVVMRIRRKLEPNPSAPSFLLTTASGYRIDLPDLSPSAISPSVISPSARPLPPELDRRVGRERELASILHQFSEGTRAITLMGAGGVGKSRLALAAGRALADGGASVVWVPSVRASDRASLCVTAAHALQLQLPNADPSGTLRRFLAAEPSLWLVLDNLEQVDGAAEEISEWLSSAPGLRVLATSRVRLHLRGAHEIVVPPLDDADAIELFADRADRPIRPHEQDDVLALVRAFDGLPLAIELAAARTRALSIAQIRAQLASSLALLSRGQGSEHRSVRASLDASLSIASPQARAALGQLSVFEGSFSADAATALLDLSQIARGVWPIDVLQELCDASLLRFDSEEGRYSLLRVVRQYAAEQLSDEARAAVESRHGHFFARVLQRLDATDPDAFYGPRRPEIIAALVCEASDLESALARAVARADVERATALSDALWPLWWSRGPFTSALARFEQLLGLSLTDPQRATVLLRCGRLRHALGQSELAEPLLEASEALAQDPAAEWSLHIALVQLYKDRGKHKEARARAERALGEAQRRGSWSAECRILMQLVFATDLDASLASLLRAEQIALSHDARGLLPGIARKLGEIETRRGQLASAERYLARAQLLGSGSSDLAEQMALLMEQSYLLRQSGRVAESIALSEACVRDCRRIGDRIMEIKALLGMGWSQSLLGRSDDAYASYLRALQLAREASARTDVCIAANALGGLAAERTDREDPLSVGQRWCREALQVATEHGEPRRLALSQQNLGRVCCLRGEHAEGMALLARALEYYEQAGDIRSTGSVLVTIGESLADAGQLEEALAHTARSRTLAQSSADQTLLAPICRLEARILAQLGRPDEAEAALEEAGAPDESTQSAGFWFARAEIAHARGEHSARRQALAEAARRIHPDSLGPRFHALSALDGRPG